MDVLFHAVVPVPIDFTAKRQHRPSCSWRCSSPDNSLQSAAKSRLIMNDRWKSGRWASQSSLKQRYKPRTDDSSVTAPPLGQLIQMLEKSDLQMASQDYLDKASIHNCELVTSYNWLDKTEPTMLIPGQHLPRLASSLTVDLTSTKATHPAGRPSQGRSPSRKTQGSTSAIRTPPGTLST